MGVKQHGAADQSRLRSVTGWIL